MRLVLAVLLSAILVENGLGASINTSFDDTAVKPSIPRVFEEPLNETLNCFRNFVEAYLQTMYIDQLNLDFDILGIEDIRGIFNIKNAYITDISDFAATYMNGQLSGLVFYVLDAVLLVRNVTVTMEYDADFAIFGVPVWGAGTLEVVITGITFDFHTRVGLITLTFSESAIKPFIETFALKITGFLNDEEHSRLLGELADELLPEWINDQAQDLSDYFGPILETILNTPSTGGGEEGDSFWDIIEGYC